MAMPFLSVMKAQAAQLTSRSWTLGNNLSAPGQSATSTFTFSAPTATTVKGVAMQFCTTASDPCTAPAGFTASWTTATVSGLGTQTTWTHNNPSGNLLQIFNNSNSGSPSATSTITVGSSVLSMQANTTVYARMITYADAALTSQLDTGIFAQSTAAVLAETATVPESLTFCVATAGISSTSCSGAAGSSVALGTLSATAATTGTSLMGIETNAFYGYAVTVNGSTLTSGTYTIPSLNIPTTSAPGTAQFGIQIAHNASSPGSATATTNYNPATNGNTYLLVDGDQVIDYASADQFTQFTATYLANISTVTPAGDYDTVLTYICTARF